jgi:dTDP-4-amino-4,6-dideoxy-D-galactose acyltransferase
VKTADAPESICTYLNWDSEFFGRRIARANHKHLDDATLQELLRWCVANRIECLYFLADSDDSQTTHLAETNGFLLADVRMTFERTLREISIVPTSVAVRPAQEEDLEPLRAIARTAHRDTRFYFDRRFERVKCDLLYETWIEKSFRGFAQSVLVAEVDQKPAGYITSHRRGDEAQVGLMGVAERNRGIGLGSILVQHFLSLAMREGAERATVTTQARNVRAQRLYQRSGFVTSSCELWYHRWSVG